MTYRDIFKTANANLRKSKLRTFLTSSAVFIGALTLMLTTGVGYGLKAYVYEQVAAAGAEDALIIFPKSESSGPVSNDEARPYNPEQRASSGDFGSMPKLTQEDIETIKQTRHVREVNPLYSLAVEYLATGEDKFQANISQGFDGLNIPLTAGRNVQANADNYEITIAPAFVEPLGFATPQDAIGKPIDISFKDYKGDLFTLRASIVGVQEKTLIQGNAMATSVALARDAFLRSTQGLPDFQRYQYAAAIARFDTSISETELSSLKAELDKNSLTGNTLDDQLGIITSIIDGITTFLNIFAAIALAAASFGIVNTLLMAVQERTREIGLMKALGLGRRKIFLLFSIEAVLIGLWSSLVALAGANILGRIGSNVASNTILKDFEGLELFSFPAMPMIGVMLLVMAIAFIASALPARRASRLNPIEALRYE